MKKLLLAFDGTHFSTGAFDFARQLNEIQPVLVTGAFLPQAQAANLWSYADAMSGPMFIPLAETNDTEVIRESISKFETLCQKNGIEYRVHEDTNDFALPELKKETRFADLLIIGSEVFYENLGKSSNEYLQDLIHGAECPVIVVPENFKFPQTTILSYDGSESSVYAIKQFAYLFPEFVSKPTLLVYVNKDEKIEFPKQSNIEELAARHYSDLTFLKLDMEPSKYFNNWVENKEGIILVCGAYGRSMISTLFKKSFIDDILADHRLPIFIAHT